MAAVGCSGCCRPNVRRARDDTVVSVFWSIRADRIAAWPARRHRAARRSVRAASRRGADRAARGRRRAPGRRSPDEQYRGARRDGRSRAAHGRASHRRRQGRSARICRRRVVRRRDLEQHRPAVLRIDRMPHLLGDSGSGGHRRPGRRPAPHLRGQPASGGCRRRLGQLTLRRSCSCKPHGPSNELHAAGAAHARIQHQRGSHADLPRRPERLGDSRNEDVWRSTRVEFSAIHACARAAEIASPRRRRLMPPCPERCLIGSS